MIGSANDRHVTIIVTTHSIAFFQLQNQPTGNTDALESDATMANVDFDVQMDIGFRRVSALDEIDTANAVNRGRIEHLVS